MQVLSHTTLQIFFNLNDFIKGHKRGSGVKPNFNILKANYYGFQKFGPQLGTAIISNKIIISANHFFTQTFVSVHS